MRYSSGQSFLDQPRKRVLFVGLSGVGKTTITSKLAQDGWTDYSVDWLIGTEYLSEEISSLFAANASNPSFIEDASRKRAIDVKTGKPVVKKHNLYALSVFVGMVGRANRGGLTEAEFRKRLDQHRIAEIEATLACTRLGAEADSNCVVDASGSLCEIVDPDDQRDPVLSALAEGFLVVYINSNTQHDELLISRQKSDPKPLYYRQDFLDKHLPQFVAETGLASIEQAEPGDVGAWMLPKLIADRRERYQKIVDRIGYRISMDDVHNANTPQEILRLLATAIDKAN